eukprot:scaffold136652_cov55-Attheya_sp.AAC.1
MVATAIEHSGVQLHILYKGKGKGKGKGKKQNIKDGTPTPTHRIVLTSLHRLPLSKCGSWQGGRNGKAN